MGDTRQETVTLMIGYRAFDRPIGRAFNIAADVGDWDLGDRLLKIGRVNDRTERRGKRKLTLDKQTYQSAVGDAIDLAGDSGDTELVETLTKLDEHIVEEG